MTQENRDKIKVLPNIDYLKQQSPLDEKGKHLIESSREQVREIFAGKDKRKILIIGPCSADFEDSLYEYATFLKKISDKVKDKIFIIMRFYTGKPRTTTGWTGMIEDGIEAVRKMGINLIKNYELPLADEMLNPHLLDYVDDIYSYLAVGARSTENQYHRQVASGLYIPVGMKNPTSGDIETMINGVIAGQTPTTYTATTQIYETKGNPFVHGILRGGKSGPNYFIENIQETFDTMKKKNVSNSSLIVDASHDNCKDENGKKHPENQIEILKYVMEQIENRPELLNLVKGFMIESYLLDGKQDENTEEPKHGLSLTDPCIGKEKTEELIYAMYDLLKSKKFKIPYSYDLE